jgi:hypothetical protein
MAQRGFLTCAEELVMTARPVIVEATLRPDGTLEPHEKLPLAPGRVQLVVQPLPDLPDDPFWQMMKRIWADQKARGHVPRTREEIDAELEQLDNEADEEMQETERLQEQYRRAHQDKTRDGGQEA